MKQNHETDIHVFHDRVDVLQRHHSPEVPVVVKGSHQIFRLESL